MKKFLLYFFLFLSCCDGYSQTKPIVFIDCSTFCDFQYMRQELDFVNIANDRQDSEVFILITALNTGLGGREVQLIFEGRFDFEGINDTIKYNVEPLETDDIQRKSMVSNIKSGLLQYLIRSSIADQITYNVASLEEKAQDVLEEHDPWNLWSFRVNGNVNFSGEAFFRSFNVNLSTQGVRIDSTQKSRFNLRANNSNAVFVLSDGEEINNFQERYNAFGVHVWSIGNQWSAGIAGGLGSTTFGNIDFDATTRLAVEYSVFSYEEANTKQFIFTYSLGPRHNNYTDTTIFNQIKETRMRQSFDVEYSKTQPWGSIFLGGSFNQYLHDITLYGSGLFGSLEWNIFKGFRINAYSSFSWIKDRINIPKSDLSDEEILLQTRQRDTSFDYYTSLSLSYRFGSKFNNIVNNRLSEEW